ncbi:Metalloproteinase inhibitor 3 [Mactra antiquata]
MATSLLILLCLSSMLVSSLACTCAETTDVNVYCHSDFVVRAEVLAAVTFQEEFRVYYINIVDNLRTNKSSIPPGASINEQFIVTPIHGGLCGVQLSVGQVSLVAGQYRLRGSTYFMETNLCINFMEPHTFNPHPSLCKMH